MVFLRIDFMVQQLMLATSVDTEDILETEKGGQVSS